jgi:hypothetical protein
MLDNGYRGNVKGEVGNTGWMAHNLKGTGSMIRLKVEEG